MSSVGDMVALITLDMGLYDETSKALCTAFLSKAYVQIWDKYPWHDTSGYGSVQVNAGTGTVNYPDGMDRLITLRATTGTGGGFGAPPPDIPDPPDDPLAPAPSQLDSRFLDPVESTFLIESEPTLFEDRGLVKYYEDVGNRTQRQVRLYPIPAWGTTLLFFGKMICPGFSVDTDQAAIRNIDPALIAYAYAEMLRRQRQYGKADIKQKEALDLETNAWNLEQQQSNLPRMTKATTVAGNSLSEMTDAVCTICGQWTPEYRQIIREFLRRNYQAFYDVFLWPESLVVVQVPFSTEQVIMPPYIDKVMGIRGTNNLRMFPAEATLILDVAPSQFDAMGTSVSYTTLTPVGVNTLPSVTTQLSIASTSSVDVRKKVAIRGEILASGQELEETVTLNGTTPVLTRYAYDIPLTIAKEITLGDVTVNAASDMRSLQLLPSYVRELKHQRFWFLPPPSNSGVSIGTNTPPFTCLVLGKRAIRPLLTDQDTPIITGVQQVLIAGAAADVFQMLGKPDQATVFQQKAGASTEVLKAKNTDQAASSPRFVPDIEPRSYWEDAMCCKW